MTVLLALHCNNKVLKTLLKSYEKSKIEKSRGGGQRMFSVSIYPCDRNNINELNHGRIPITRIHEVNHLDRVACPKFGHPVLGSESSNCALIIISYLVQKILDFNLTDKCPKFGQGVRIWGTLL